ncbi:MAG TPA: hypothetical protein DD490_05550, partial [Acidobacteria bacterium]|nr:hypothetical protein [Acidobacteriota bacterium]
MAGTERAAAGFDTAAAGMTLTLAGMTAATAGMTLTLAGMTAATAGSIPAGSREKPALAGKKPAPATISPAAAEGEPARAGHGLEPAGLDPEPAGALPAVALSNKEAAGVRPAGSADPPEPALAIPLPFKIASRRSTSPEALMAGTKVFVSYSHEDADDLQDLWTFLAPLQREGRVDAWADTRLEGGDAWSAEIDAALDAAGAAVLLISQAFLASTFIAERELPPLLERAAAGRLTVLPVFLSPSTVEDTPLARFQGYGSPKKPLSAMSWSNRQKEYTKLAKRLRSIGGAAPVVVRPVETVPRPAPGSSAGREHGLTVLLERTGDTLQVRHRVRGSTLFSPLPLPWSDVSAACAEAARVLDVAGAPGLRSWLAGAGVACGQTLGRIVLGGSERWGPLLRAVYGTADGAAQPTPLFAPVRLRLVTMDALLAGLPWRLAAWNGRSLVDAGWTIEGSEVEESLHDESTTAPAGFLAVLPNAPDTGHETALRELLAKVWPTQKDAGYFRAVRTREQLANALKGMRPHVLYLYAQGEVRGDRPELLLGGGERLAVAALPRLFKDAGHRPAVVCFNTAGLASSRAPSPASLLGGTVPLVLWRRLPEWTAESTTVALDGLGRWLGKGEDPVTAFHAAARDHDEVEAATLGITTAYRTWRTEVFRGAPGRRDPLRQLDRDHQKALVRKHLGELVTSGTRRVMALLAYGEAGNSIETLSEQLRFDLESATDHEINWLHLQFPVDRDL